MLTRSRDGAVVGVFASQQCDPVLIPAPCQMWVELVDGVLTLVRGIFSGFSDISPSTNIQFGQRTTNVASLFFNCYSLFLCLLS